MGVGIRKYVVAIFYIRRIIPSLFDASTERLIASDHTMAILLRLTDLVSGNRGLIIFLITIQIIFVVVDHSVQPVIYFNFFYFHVIKLNMIRSIHTNSDMLIAMMRVVVSSCNIKKAQVGRHG